MKPIYDPYDIWSIPLIGRLKQRWSRGDIAAKVLLPIIGMNEFLIPVIWRRMLGTDKHVFAHVNAMLVMTSLNWNEDVIDEFIKLRVGGNGWGLPFDWYSKNGIYDANTAYITNTPYVMEALVKMMSEPSLRSKATTLFHDTWGFVESLKVLTKGVETLALSYAPIDEPRIVINANSYAALAYALHAAYGKDDVQGLAREKAEQIARWIVSQQERDGSWFYYADRESGNFIDGFHSCFVVKNLLKVKRLIPELSGLVDESIERGWQFIRTQLFDASAGLSKRFVVRSHRDPFQWDLYDQAEYLGLLVDFGRLNEAREFADHVDRKFQKGGHWFCRIDIFGRRWGRDFLRWGIVPFWYHRSRLVRTLSGETE